MQFKKHIRRIARIGQKASHNFAKRIGKNFISGALTAGGAAAGGAIGAFGGPAGVTTGALIGSALGREAGGALNDSIYR